jgi:GTP-binding protein HflX
MVEFVEQVRVFDKALLIGIYTKSNNKDPCVDSLEELAGLATTYGLEVVDQVPCYIRKFSAATLLGKGKLQELSALIQEFGVDLVIFDDEISPHQQRNLEKELKKPIMDRTELIIEVFAQRAQTNEARLQVELAKVRYQLPRLKRLWTHLSRQSAGGGGFLKGEGEKQIELDRRMLQHRITRLQKEIEEVRAKRAVQRSSRIRTAIPTFAIVGYTNAGKSTLMRALTKADVLVEDKLFATLDTTTRKYTLPNNQSILLIDTVGFIRKIPTTLISAFKSTLEEAVFTDILIHLIDASSRHAIEQAEATLQVLEELGAKERPCINVLNKIDRCEDQGMLRKLRIKYPKTVAISATEGRGFDQLIDLMVKEVAALRKVVKLRIPQSHYALVSELMSSGRVIEIEYEANDVLMEVEIPANLESKVEMFIQEAL